MHTISGDENCLGQKDTVYCVAFCPNCGNRAPQRLLLQHDYDVIAYGYDGSRETDGCRCRYFVASCSTCSDLLLYHSNGAFERPEWFTDAQLVFPGGIDLPEQVPLSVRETYAEAATIQKLAPNAFAVLIRRGLEALCDDRGVKSGTLHKKLAELAARGEIPATLAEVTAVLRELGNSGAHNSGRRISVPLTWAMDEFFRTIVEYVYVAPSKLKAFKELLAKVDAEQVANPGPQADG